MHEKQITIDTYRGRKENDTVQWEETQRWGGVWQLGLGDRPGQLSGWNVLEKYVAYSWRTGNKAHSPPLLPHSLHSFTLNSAACIFASLSISSPLCLCGFLSLSPTSSCPLGVSSVRIPSVKINSFIPFHARGTRTAC